MVNSKNTSSFRQSTTTKGKVEGVSSTSTHNPNVVQFNPTPKQALAYLKLKDNQVREIGYGGGA